MFGKILLHILLGRMKQDISKKVWFVAKSSWGVWDGGSSATPEKSLQFYPHLSFEIMFPALNLLQNCCIMNICSLPNKYALPERQGKTGKNLEVQSKLIFQNHKFQSPPFIEKNWEVQLE